MESFGEDLLDAVSSAIGLGSRASTADREAILRQCGRRALRYLPLWICRRCRYGLPVAHVSFHGERPEGSRAFLDVSLNVFWLSCPYLVKLVARLEASGWLRLLNWLIGFRSVSLVLEREDRGYLAAVRTLFGALRGCAPSVPPYVRRISEGVESVGVGGRRYCHTLKCLHSFLAHSMCRRPREGIGAFVEALVALDGVSPRLMSCPPSFMNGSVCSGLVREYAVEEDV